MTGGAAERYRELRRAVDEEAHRCGRDPSQIAVVGIAKGQPNENVAAAITAGLADVGENYLQEARRRFPALPAVRKHFVGHVQTNKARAISALFDVVQSVDRLEAATALSRAAKMQEKTLAVLLQLNVSPAERFGCAPADAPRLAEALRRLPGLALHGVMAIGPLTGERSEISSAFELAAKTLARIGGSTLSMGMSGDWREAVRAGSTMLRIGEALFGHRPSKGGTGERL
ncbi:MAG: YggS family pyridoxal phosphate-dependent enzyme [Candidatus Eremiobacteraeota bacterium]|nr:YggS family pyridoxal phosphate-dependent enzyme [Candidatus Eremiobacteraeota bacterium]